MIHSYPWIGIVHLISFFPLMNGILVTIWTKFILFQSNMCIASISLSHLSRSPHEYFINTILDTISAPQSNIYSYITVLGHKITLDIGSTFLFDLKRKKVKRDRS